MCARKTCLPSPSRAKYLIGLAPARSIGRTERLNPATTQKLLHYKTSPRETFRASRSS